MLSPVQMKKVRTESDIRNFLVKQGINAESNVLTTFTTAIYLILVHKSTYDIIGDTAKELDISPYVVRSHLYRAKKEFLTNCSKSGKALFYELADKFVNNIQEVK